MQVAAAWLVHALTAAGGVAGLAALAAIADHAWKWAFFWMIVTVSIDGIDGTLARAFRVKEVVPGFDGALLDNIVDYLTFTIVPAFFIYESGLLPAGTGFLAAAAIVLASSYQFCQADAKTDDHYFTGFPSYWNVVALYLFLLEWSPLSNLALIAALVVLTPVPIKYIYPTRTRWLRPLTLVLSIVWAASLAIALMYHGTGGHAMWVNASFLFVVYYVALSAVVNLRPHSPEGPA